MKNLKDNWHMILVVIVILVILISSLYFWYQAERWANLIQDSDGWYAWPELARMGVRDAYNLAFKKILLVSGFLFASTFLSIMVTHKKK